MRSKEGEFVPGYALHEFPFLKSILDTEADEAQRIVGASLSQESARLRVGDDRSRGPARAQRPGRAERCDGRHIAGTTITSGPDQHAVGCIHAVAGAVTPEEVEAGIQLDPRREPQAQRRMDVREVAWPKRRLVAEIISAWVEGIEGAEAVVIRIPVAAGNGEEQRHP